MPSTPTFRRLPRSVREQQMLDAAVKVFSRRGFHDASMDEIAEAAGISKPMVYAYLGSKEELFVACLRRESTRLLEAITDAVTGAGAGAPVDEQLWSGLRAFFRFVGAHRDGWAVLYRQARGRQPFATEVAAMRDRMIQAVSVMLRQALGPDHRVHDSELTAMAYALVGAGESLADWLCDHPDAEPDAVADRMMTAAWLGTARLLAGETWHPAP